MRISTLKFLFAFGLMSSYAVVSNAESGSMSSHKSSSSCVIEPTLSSSPSEVSSSSALASSPSSAESSLNLSSASLNKNTKSKKRKSDPFIDIHQMIRMDDYRSAHAALKLLHTPHRQADKFNLMGLVAQKTGNLTSSMNYYQKALSINSRHVQALNNQAELFLQIGKVESAKENLGKINEICWLGCNEKTILEDAIKLATK